MFGVSTLHMLSVFIESFGLRVRLPDVSVFIVISRSSYLYFLTFNQLIVIVYRSFHRVDLIKNRTDKFTLVDMYTGVYRLGTRHTWNP